MFDALKETIIGPNPCPWPWPKKPLDTKDILIMALLYIMILILTKGVATGTAFAICRAIAQTLEEDLQFLKNHISEETINGSINVLGLVTTGLMHMVFNNPDGGSLYSFTELAKKVNRYAIKPINKVP